MATLTATLDTHGVRYRNGGGTVTGTFTTSDNVGAIDDVRLLPTTCVLTAFEAFSETGPSSLGILINTDDEAATVNGTVQIRNNASDASTFRFIAHFLGS